MIRELKLTLSSEYYLKIYYFIKYMENLNISKNKLNNNTKENNFSMWNRYYLNERIKIDYEKYLEKKELEKKSTHTHKHNSKSD